MGAALSSSPADMLGAAVVKAGQDLLACDLDEASVSGGPVKRRLAALDRDVFDPLALCPEVRVGTARVHFALCRAVAGTAPQQPTGCGYSVQDGPWKAYKDGKATYLALLDFRAKEAHELHPGGYVGRQTNPDELEKRSHAACKAVGLDFGREVKASSKR